MSDDVEPVEDEEEEKSLVPDVAEIVRERLSDLPPEVVSQVTANLQQYREDYTSTHVERKEEVLDPVITELLRVFRDKEELGSEDLATDRWGNPIEIQGAKGNIPLSKIHYIIQSNLGSILPHLVNNVYNIEYKRDENGNIVRGDDGKPVIMKKEPVHLSVELKKLELLTYLGVNANRALLQAKVMVGAQGSVSPMGIDPMWDSKILSAMDSFFGGKKKRILGGGEK